jgi:hypothetical protein
MAAQGMIGALKSVYKGKYILLNAAAAAVYYTIIEKMISLQGFGVAIATAPIYMIYAVVLTSSMLLTIGVYLIFNRRAGASYGGTASGSATALAGGIFGGCGCHSAILYPVLAIAVGGTNAAFVDTLIGIHATAVFAALSLLNIGLMAYYLNAIGNPKCNVRARPKKGK